MGEPLAVKPDGIWACRTIPCSRCGRYADVWLREGSDPNDYLCVECETGFKLVPLQGEEEK